MDKQYSILIVGDEDVFSELLGLLPPTRYTLCYAGDLGEGLAQLEQQRPAVVVAVLDRGEPLDDLLTQAKARGASCIGLTCTGFDPPGAEQCEEVFAVDEIERVSGVLDRLLAERPAAAAPAQAPHLEIVAKRLQDLERRVSEVAVGTTHGLSELLQATDGVNQGLKLHARLLQELEQRIEAGGEAQPTAQDDGSVRQEVAQQLERVAERLERLESLEGRVGEVAFGTTDSQAGDEDQPEEALVQRLGSLRERLESLEGRVGEVAMGITHGLSELLQATDGLGQGLKAQARVLAQLEQRLGEHQARLEALERAPGEE